ncbi:methyltransferase domain-containing protein [Actinoplanes sp. NPDC051851]|uniref:class I SAM-dependent methyltransferase n=1 Tax=Actinoplanes sp. NPDC051851 TaxID=3154753 RepID=UPI00341E6FE8
MARDVFDEVAAEYDNLGVDFFTPMGTALVEAAGVKPGDRLLDVGCGRGAVLLPAAEAVGATGHVTATDRAPAMVELTRRSTAHLPQVTVEVGDAQAPDFPAGSFDVITAGLVIFFLPDAAAALHAYRKLLRPEGKLAFSTFAAQDPRYVAAIRALSALLETPPPRPAAMTSTFQNPDWLRSTVAGAGFPDARITTFTVESRFRDVAHLLAWTGSHAGANVARRVPVEQAVGALTPIFPDGPPSLTTTINLVVAS